MFGLIVAGRLVQTDFKPIPNDPSKFTIEIPQPNDVNHIVVFLTGTQPFALGTGGQVYFGWPDETNQVGWHLLGHITNDKPSAIFKISHLKKAALQSLISPSFFGPAAAMNLGVGMGNLGLGTVQPQPIIPATPSAQIGISIEPVDAILQTTPAAGVAPATVGTFVEFSQKMLENLVNYATSFGDANHITLQTLHNWYENFQRRLQADPNFWR